MIDGRRIFVFFWLTSHEFTRRDTNISIFKIRFWLGEIYDTPYTAGVWKVLPEFCMQIARSEVWGQVTAIDLARQLLR